MAGKVVDSAKNMFSTIGAIQTLVENFPMNFISFGDLKFASSFDVLSILFKILGVDRDELIEVVTNALCGGSKDTSDGSGFISQAEEIVKIALETNIINILNCTTNPIITNNLLDSYKKLEVEESGEGITLNVSEVDFTGVLSKNPFFENDSKFYFDVENYNANTIWKSKDFNAYLWYIINKSDKSQTEERIWDNRYKAAIYGKNNDKKKEIIKCTYIDEEYPNTDKIKVQICGARPDASNKLSPANYYKTRKLSNKENSEWALNKTIFEFNHDFLSSIKLYEPKVIIAEIVEYLLGNGNFSVNLGFSINEELIQGKIQQIVKNVIEIDDLEINDCYYSFSNEEYNKMLEESEKNRYNIINNGNGCFEVNPSDILEQLSGITSNSTLNEDKAIISKTLTDIIATPAKDPSGESTMAINYDWEFELIRMLAYPFIRPLFTPKVIFLLLVNKKIMGKLDENANVDLDDLMNGLFLIIKDIILKLKDLLVDMLLSYALKKLSPLLALFASRLLLETLKMYKDLLMQILRGCSISGISLSNPFGWLSDTANNNLVGVIDDVNYADIIPIQVEPEQTIC